MEAQDIESIEQYYSNALNTADLLEFKRRMADEPAFREAVALHGDALEAIRMEGSALLRARLLVKGRQLDAQTAKHNRSPWRWLLFGLPVLLLGGMLWWLAGRGTPAAPPVVPAKEHNTAPVRPDTAPVIPSPKEQKASEQPAHKTPTNQQLYATWFKPYRDASLEPTRRGEGDASPSERFQQLYWDGDYDAALAIFDSLPKVAQQSDNLLFLKANCLLTTGQAREAAVLLEAILRNGRTRFTAQTPWYLALSRLHRGDRAGAEVLLRQMADDPSSPRNKEAQRLLRAWQ